MSYKYPFLDLLSDLQRATEDLVLVGGWVPTVYFEYLWRCSTSPIQTKDIDLAIHSGVRLKQPLTETFKRSIYKEKHLELGKLKPYQIIYGDKIPIDFLSDSQDEAFARDKILEGMILLNVAETYRFLLKSYLTVNCDRLPVNVPQPARYILHKFWLYLNTQEPRPRDIAMGYYCLTRSPKSGEIYKEIGKIREESDIKTVIERIPDLRKDDLLIVDIESVLRSIGQEESRQVIYRKLKQLAE